jgi:hypothetical protein
MKTAFLFSLLCCTARGVQPACAAMPAVALLDIEMCWAEYYARAFGVPLEFVQAVIDVESAWRPDAISKASSGLWQPPTMPARSGSGSKGSDAPMRTSIAT